MSDSRDVDTVLTPKTEAQQSVQGVEHHTVLELDVEEYRADIADFDLTKEQQEEFLRALWSLLCGFVDLGWGVDNVQLLLPEIFNNGQDSGKLLKQKDHKIRFENVTKAESNKHSGKEIV